MGCDIHCYIEYREKDSGRWRDFGGRINPGRNYAVFERMAGVRGDTAMFEPRGLPENISHASQNDSRLYITNDGAGDDECSKENADRWIKSGCSKLVDEKWVTNPDWHSHSWLTAQELESAVDAAQDKYGQSAQEYRAIIAAMRCFEELGYVSRVVFWFDN